MFVFAEFDGKLFRQCVVVLSIMAAKVSISGNKIYVHVSNGYPIQIFYGYTAKTSLIDSILISLTTQ